MSKIGIFGGSFNPIHNGHLEIARLAFEACKLDTVIFVPSGNPPHKPNRILESGKDRLEMVRLAVKGQDFCSVSDYEITKPELSYSVKTLKYMHGKYPKSKLYFIMGSDSLIELHSWHSAAEFSALCSVIAVNREKPDNADAVRQASDLLTERYGIDIIFIPIPEINISSTDLRSLLKEEKSIEGLVPDAVSSYIKKHNLYMR